MGKAIQAREGKVRSAMAKLRDLIERQELTPEEAREGVRRHLLVVFGGSYNTIESILDETFAKYEHAREKETVAALT